MTVDWDQWRARYDTTTFEQQVAFYERVYREHPTQASFNPLTAAWALEDAETVVEVGGWTGDLAARMLHDRRDIRWWANYDLCASAVLHPATRDFRYLAVPLEKWPWDKALPPADAFVATHVIEHMRLHQLQRLAAQFPQYRTVYLEAPLEPEPTDWTGYEGSHILEVGWRAVDRLLAACGFTVALAERWSRAYQNTKIP